MAPIQYTASMENNNSATAIASAKCESSMSMKTSSSSAQSSQCQQTFTKTSEQLSNTDQSSHVSGFKSGSEMKVSSSSLHSTNKDDNKANINQNSPMTIQTRGNFFEDSLFADVRENFERAVSEVLEKCGERSSLCNNMISYRKIRQQDLKEENQVGIISYGEKEHKIVLDVHDFKQENIKVKVVENNTIQITGHMEKKNGNSVSTQSFHRQFTLPGTVDMTMVTSIMSSDGILTILVPKLENNQTENTKHESGSSSELSRNKEINQCHTKDNKATENCMETTQSEDSKSSVISQTFNSKPAVESQSLSYISNSTDVCSEDKDTIEKSIKHPAQMTITKRGNFFEDSFFADVHANFQRAISEVLEKWGEKSSLCDDMTSYRILRQRDLKEENQAATVAYGEKEHKIVLDAKDFKQSDIKVQIIGDNTIQITGHMEKKNVNAISTQSFHRQFTLPGTLDMTLVTSNMSSDGILTVIIPRVATQQMISNTENDSICKESNLNKEANQSIHENTLTIKKAMKTMKAEETKSSISSPTLNIESGIGENLSSSNSMTADVSSDNKSYNLNKERNIFSNEKAATLSKLSKTNNTENPKTALISQESHTESGNETNLSSLNSNTTDVGSEGKDTHGTSNSHPEPMTIRKRGNFFEDPFFADVHTHFQKAVSEVLEKFGKNLSVEDDMTSYRNLRQRNLKEENQAATVSYGEKEHKIVLDVNDFKKDDIKLKIIENDTVQITGHIENKNGNIMSTQSFHRQFTLPGTLDMTMVTSSMSSDGILTVTIPRVETQQMISHTKKDRMCKESNLNKVANQSNDGNTLTTEKARKIMKAEETKSSISSQVLSIESGNAHSNGSTATLGKSIKTNNTEDSKSALISQESHTESGNETNLSSLNSNTTDICSEDKDKEGASNSQPESMTIRKRGNFFEDSFFADVHTNFQKAVSEVLEKFGENSSIDDDMTSYRNLRQHDLKEENQAATVSYGDKEHKIVLDVNDFKEGDIKVKVIENDTVQITGHIEKKNGNSISKQSFHRQFTLPGTLDMTLVTSTMSSDGILTVTIPSLASKQMLSDSNEEFQNGKQSNVNKEAKQWDNDNQITTGKSTRTMKDDKSRSSVMSQVSSKTGKSTNKMKDSKSFVISQNSNITTAIEAQIVPTKNKAIDVRSGDMNKETNHEISKNIVKNDETLKNEKIKAYSDSEEYDKKLNTEVISSNCNKKTSTNDSTKINENISTIIKKKGKFFEDPFFGNVQANFNKAVSEIMKNCGKSLSLCDSMESYKNFRKHNLQEENRAVTVSYGEKEHEIILDVHDFTKEDIKIKSVENTIEVTGPIRNNNGNAVSTRSFHRKFTLPDTVDTASVTSSMSSDGILTITVPTINEVFTKNTHGLFNNRIDSGEMPATNSEKQCSEKFHKVSKCEEQATKHHLQQSSSYNSSQISSSTLGSIQAPSHSSSFDKITGASDLFSPINLSIRRRGQFFQDSFFNDSQQQLDEAMKSILNELGNTNQVINTEQRYRNLRQKELKEEQQACSMKQDSQNHKIVIDVKEFMEGSINVKVIGETKIHVEGENKQEKGISKASRRFNRSFVLPNKIDVSSVQSSLSSDGILSITVPKMLEAPGNAKY